MATRDLGSARSSTKGTVMGYAPKVDPITSRILRRLGSQVNSTDSLVSLYNQTKDEQERSALQKWLYAYRPFFDRRYAKCYGYGVLEEITRLARINVSCDEDEELVMDLISSLANQVYATVIDVRKTVSPLASVLGEIDGSIFLKDISPLLKIVNVLFSKLDPKTSVFTEKSYPTHRTTLFALQHCLLMIQRIAPEMLDPRIEEGFFQTNMAYLSNVIDHQTYFPLLFHTKLVEQCMDRLADNQLFTNVSVSGRMLTFLSGCIYAYNGLRKTFVADLDLDSLKKASQKLRISMAGLRGKEVWYDEYVKLNTVSALSCKDADGCTDIDVFFQNALKVERGLTNSQEKNLLRFGIVDQLHCIALNGESFQVREFAVTELMNLGTCYISCEGWDEEPAVVEGIVLALQDMVANSEHTELGETALEVIRAQGNSVVRVRPSGNDSI